MFIRIHEFHVNLNKQYQHHHLHALLTYNTKDYELFGMWYELTSVLIFIFQINLI